MPDRALSTRRRRIVAPISWMILIFWSSSQTWPGAVQSAVAWLPVWLAENVPPDKLLHGTIYTVLAGTWAWALPGRPALWWLLSVAFGALDEVHQGLVPGRSQDALDWVADAAGAALAVVLWPLLQRAGRSFAPRAPT